MPAGDVEDRWTLRAADRALLGNKTGATRLGFAVLLKLFQPQGRFPRRSEDADPDDLGQRFRLTPDADPNPRRTGIPMIPSRVVVDVVMGSGDGFGVKHDRLGSSFTQ